MRINLAWKNVVLNKRRTGVALLGIAFSVLLMFMQIGFLRSMRHNTTIVYDALDFDLLIASEKYLNLVQTEPFDATRLVQARGVAGVAAVAPFNFALAEWKNKDTEVTRTCAIAGFPDDPAFVRQPEIRAQLARLEGARTVLADLASDQAYGALAPGAAAELAGQNITVAGVYRLGLALYAKGTAIVSQATFQLLTRAEPRQVSFGLVRLAPGTDRARGLAALRAALPGDVLVFERDAMMAAEQAYYLDEKPVGVIFRAGAIVSFIVGSVIFYQVLSTEIANKLKEFATLRALGFADRYVYKVGIQQALLYALLAYAPCALYVWWLFGFIGRAAKMQMPVGAGFAALVLGLTLTMCGAASYLALQRVKRADPADLF